MIIIRIKQHLTTFEVQFIKQLSNTEDELNAAYKKMRVV